jgi:protoporphyrinogen oxidase
MASKNNIKLHILGAGPAGLAAGYFAKKSGIPFHIFEASGVYGGNCRTIVEGDYRFDTGAHRFHDKNQEITKEIKSLMRDELQLVDAPSKIFINDNFIDFPLRLKDLFIHLHTGDMIKIIFENIQNILRAKRSPMNFKELAYSKYGFTLSELFLIGYTEKLWGKESELLHTDVAGDRLKKLNLLSFISEMIFKNKRSDHLDGSFYYPISGFGSIFDKIVEFIGIENISFNSPVRKLLHKDKRLEEIVYGDNDSVKVTDVINTLPVDLTTNIFEPLLPKEIQDGINNIKYRNLKLCTVFLNISQFSPNASIYFPEISNPITRIYEPKNRSSKMAPKDKTCIVVEVPYSIGDDTSSLVDEDIYSLIKTKLKKLFLIKEEDISGFKVMDLSNAYPILMAENQYQLKKTVSFLNTFDNHHMIGRNSEFKYLHTHDIMLRAKRLIENFL